MFLPISPKPPRGMICSFSFAKIKPPNINMSRTVLLILLWTIKIVRSAHKLLFLLYHINLSIPPAPYGRFPPLRVGRSGEERGPKKRAYCRCFAVFLRKFSVRITKIMTPFLFIIFLRQNQRMPFPFSHLSYCFQQKSPPERTFIMFPKAADRTCSYLFPRASPKNKAVPTYR